MTEDWPSAPPPVVAVGSLPPHPGLPRTKVLHVITRFWAGAGGNTLLSVTGADPLRYEMWVAGGPGGSLYEVAERAGARTVLLPRFREVISPVRDLATWVALVRLMRRERFDVVHTHSTKAGLVGRLAARWCRVPVVVHTFHGFAVHDGMSRRRRQAYLLLERAVRSSTHGFAAVAPRVAAESVLLRLARPGSVRVIPSAVDLAAVPQDHVDDLARQLAVAPDAPIIGTVGRIDEQKAPLDFVRMAAFVHAGVPNARFVMVGEGPLASEVRALADALAVPLAITGHREDAVRLVAGMDVFVICSAYEGLGRALTEALAAGRPVVATAVNGIPDLVEHGATGLLVAPGQPQQTADAVRWLLDHPDAGRRMGAQGRARARAGFSQELMCQRLDALYRDLLGLPAAVDRGAVQTEARSELAAVGAGA